MNAARSADTRGSRLSPRRKANKLGSGLATLCATDAVQPDIFSLREGAKGDKGGSRELPRNRAG